MQTLRKSLFFISRPISFFAMFILVINDYWLRKIWPSWWTGKIGDFAWLFFAPFAFTALVALCLPVHPKREHWISWITFGFIGCGFTLTKTVPGFNQFVAQLASMLVGFPVRISLDPTDLLALVTLFFGFWLWQRKSTFRLPFTKRGWIAIPLAALVTLADAAAADYGINCLSVQNQQVQASSAYWSYTTADGGLSWQESPQHQNCTQNAQAGKIIDTQHPNYHYRFLPGVVIESSTDAGKSWQPEFSLSLGSPAKQAYYQKTHAGSPTIKPGPLDGLIDPTTGNVIFAMGHEGVLVRETKGSWVWVTLGNYQHIEMTQTSAFFSLLWGEIGLALCLSLLLLGTWLMMINRTTLSVIGVSLGWIVWGISALMFPPAISSQYGAYISTVVLITTSMLSILVGLRILFLYFEGKITLPYQVFVQAGIGSLCFFLPYGFWAINALSSYRIALIFALLFSVINLLIGFYLLKEFPKATPKQTIV
jgi:hypothetical protein